MLERKLETSKDATITTWFWIQQICLIVTWFLVLWFRPQSIFLILVALCLRVRSLFPTFGVKIWLSFMWNPKIMVLYLLDLFTYELFFFVLYELTYELLYFIYLYIVFDVQQKSQNINFFFWNLIRNSCKILYNILLNVLLIKNAINFRSFCFQNLVMHFFFFVHQSSYAFK